MREVGGEEEIERERKVRQACLFTSFSLLLDTFTLRTCKSA